jgi:uncharacterized protein YjeT (DUF2065 family)|tara:strand:- start:135 stop:323 length:189 start_codon:yes stop_codon:yes gene_type:complete
MLWHELGVGLCLVLVIEGIMPFLFPHQWQEMALKAAEIDEKTMRAMGLASMLIGTGLLYLIN